MSHNPLRCIYYHALLHCAHFLLRHYLITSSVLSSRVLHRGMAQPPPIQRPLQVRAKEVLQNLLACVYSNARSRRKEHLIVRLVMRFSRQENDWWSQMTVFTMNIVWTHYLIALLVTWFFHQGNCKWLLLSVFTVIIWAQYLFILLVAWFF